MKLKALSLFLTLILLSSCAGSKYFAQEFSASTLETALHQSLGYNKKDGFYYDILKEGGYLFNIASHRILTNKFDSAYLKEKGLNKKAENIQAFESFNKKYSLLDEEKLENGIFKAIPVYDNENYALNIETTRMENAVKSFISNQYSIENNAFKKLKLENVSLSAIKTESFTACPMPYIKAEYTVTATYKEKTVSKKLTDSFLIEITQNGNKFEYSIGYHFYFDSVFKEKDFEESMAIALNKEMPTLTVQGIFEDIDISKIEVDYKENWLEISRYTKTISEKYLYFLQQGSDLTNQISTQNSSYLTDTVFIGDSIFEGFTFYGLADHSNVLSKVGVGTRNVLEMDLTADGKDYTFDEFILKQNPKRVYIMLGLNDINMISEKQYNDYYIDIIKTVQRIAPEADVVLTSITPIRKMSFSTPERIEKYNAISKEIAKKTEKVYYLSLFEYLSVNGILATKYSAQDGIHFSFDTYRILMNFLNCHQLKGDTKPEDLLSLEKLEQMRVTPLRIDETAIEEMVKAEKEKGKSSPMREIPKIEEEALPVQP